MNDRDEEFTSPVFSMETLMRAIVNPDGKKVIVNGVPAEIYRPLNVNTIAPLIVGVMFIVMAVLAMVVIH